MAQLPKEALPTTQHHLVVAAEDQTGRRKVVSESILSPKQMRVRDLIGIIATSAKPQEAQGLLKDFLTRARAAETPFDPTFLGEEFLSALAAQKDKPNGGNLGELLDTGALIASHFLMQESFLKASTKRSKDTIDGQPRRSIQTRLKTKLEKFQRTFIKVLINDFVTKRINNEQTKDETTNRWSTILRLRLQNPTWSDQDILTEAETTLRDVFTANTYFIKYNYLEKRDKRRSTPEREAMLAEVDRHILEGKLNFQQIADRSQGGITRRGVSFRAARLLDKPHGRKGRPKKS